MMVNFTRWWEYPREEVMSQFYWLRRQLPPSGEDYDEAWTQLSESLQNKYPKET